MIQERLREWIDQHFLLPPSPWKPFVPSSDYLHMIFTRERLEAMSSFLPQTPTLKEPNSVQD